MPAGMAEAGDPSGPGESRRGSQPWQPGGLSRRSSPARARRRAPLRPPAPRAHAADGPGLADLLAHLRDLLADAGFIVLGGPVGDGEQTLNVVEAADENEIRTRLAQDPWALAGLLQIGTVEPGALWLDGRPQYPARDG